MKRRSRSQKAATRKSIVPSRTTTKSSIRPFSDSLPMQLLRVREAVMERFRPHLHAHEMSEQQWRIVRALAEAEELEIHEVGKRCCIHPASFSHMLPKLEAAGMILRRSSMTDKRRIVVSLTPVGRRTIFCMGRESEEIYAEISRRLGPNRVEELYRQLTEALNILTITKPQAKSMRKPIKIRKK